MELRARSDPQRLPDLLWDHYLSLGKCSYDWHFGSPHSRLVKLSGRSLTIPPLGVKACPGAGRPCLHLSASLAHLAMPTGPIFRLTRPGGLWLDVAIQQARCRPSDHQPAPHPSGFPAGKPNFAVTDGPRLLADADPVSQLDGADCHNAAAGKGGAAPRRGTTGTLSQVPETPGDLLPSNRRTTELPNCRTLLKRLRIWVRRFSGISSEPTR